VRCCVANIAGATTGSSAAVAASAAMMGDTVTSGALRTFCLLKFA
jgi:hypothetical protein